GGRGRDPGGTGVLDLLAPRVGGGAVDGVVMRRPEPLECRVGHHEDATGAQHPMTLPERGAFRYDVPVIEEVEAETRRERAGPEGQCLGYAARQPSEPAPSGQLERSRVSVDPDPGALPR